MWYDQDLIHDDRDLQSSADAAQSATQKVTLKAPKTKPDRLTADGLGIARLAHVTTERDPNLDRTASSARS